MPIELQGPIKELGYYKFFRAHQSNPPTFVKKAFE
jgi:hypothetical protein